MPHDSSDRNPSVPCSQVCIRKQKGEILGIAIVESGWGSILPTVVIANLMHGGPAERSGELSIGDRLMSVNGTSLVGLPLTTCQSIIRVSQGCAHGGPCLHPGRRASAGRDGDQPECVWECQGPPWCSQLRDGWVVGGCGGKGHRVWGARPNLWAVTVPALSAWEEGM